MNQIVRTNGNPPTGVIENVVIRGDLSKLNDDQRTSYYMTVCKSVGLNPLTKPFEYITLNGRLTLYALRNCTDQLRQIHKISVVDMSEAEREGVYIVTCKVVNDEGRTDMAKGAVNIGGLKGEVLANALMKAETKAKRRATLSICGLSLLDETEVEDIPRQNPHVTRREDLEDEPAPEGWRFKQTDDPTKLLKKSDPKQREYGSQLQQEAYLTQTAEQAREWFLSDAVQERAEVMRQDWLDQLCDRLWNKHFKGLLAEEAAAAQRDPSSEDQETA